MRRVPRTAPTRPTVYARRTEPDRWRWYYFMPLNDGNSVSQECDSWSDAMGWLGFWIKRQDIAS